MTTMSTNSRSTSPTRATTGGSEPAEVAAARLLLERLGVRPEELLNHTGTAPGGTDSAVAVPTIGEYLQLVDRKDVASIFAKAPGHRGTRAPSSGYCPGFPPPVEHKCEGKPR